MLSWWQWLAVGLVAPAIVALYFLRLKRRPLEVPSTYLWRKSIEDLHVNALWQRLRRNLLLWLQLLLVALLILALGRPGWQSQRLGGTRFIFLVDNSASMQATDVAPSRLADAQRRCAEFIDQMRSGDVAMVVSFADTARIEQTFTDNRGLLRRAVQQIQPTQRRTALGEALKVAAGLANPGRGSASGDTPAALGLPTKLLIFSDGKFEDVADFALGNLEPVFIPIGSPAAANVALTALGWRRDESRAEALQVYARVDNFGPGSVEVPLELYRDEQLIGADRLTVEGGKSSGATFDLRTLESGVLRLRAGVNDDLALDNEAYAVVSAPRRARVLLVTPGNPPLVWGLTTAAAAEIADVRVESPGFLAEKFARELSQGGFDLVIFDRCRPAEMPPCNTWFIGSLPPKGWTVKEQVARPQILDTDPQHPLTQWLDLGNVLIAEGTPLVLPPGGKTLVDSQAGPLAAIAARETYEDFVLGFLLLQSGGSDGTGDGTRFATDWPLRGSFPVFLRNVLLYLGGRHEAGAQVVYRPGQPVPLRTATSVSQLTIRPPSGQAIALQATHPGEFTFTGTQQIGVYRTSGEGTAVDPFAVNLFDGRESDLRPRIEEEIKIGHVDVAASRGWEVARREIWKVLLVLGLFVAWIEWYIYTHRISM